MRASISILGYGCESGAGSGVAAFLGGLYAGRDFTRGAETFERPASMRDRLAERLVSSFEQFLFPPGAARLGVILASSKGCHEDWVWGEAPAENDPLTPVLDEFLARTGIVPTRKICVSNACASALSAIFLAKRWLEAGVVRDVLVAAAEGIGPFIARGFSSLAAVSSTSCRPFSGDRDGLRLGEAAGVLWLSTSEGAVRILGAGIDAEGFAVTRSSESGESLIRAARAAGATRPDFILAHGTATLANDRVEDRAYTALFPERPPISATKWSIGHSLGASGIMDIIAACEVLRTGTLFPIATTRTIDAEFHARYATEPVPVGREALVASLGFGGVHAAVSLCA